MRAVPFSLLLLACGSGEPPTGLPDRDRDGYAAGADCDDRNPAVHPGAADAWYDGLDSNCDGKDDEDADQDGSPRATDCDDAAPQVHPGAARVCGNGVDDDCDGQPDCDLRGERDLEANAAARIDALQDDGGNDAATGDFDGDGERDLFLVSAFADSTLVFGPLDAPDPPRFALAGGSNGGALADVDGDGRAEAATCSAGIFGGTCRIWNGVAQGGLRTQPDATLVYPPGEGGEVGVSTLGDVTGDAAADLVVTSMALSRAVVYPGPFAGDFTPDAAAATLTGGFGTGVSVGTGDLDGDGLGDLVVLNSWQVVYLTAGPVSGAVMLDDGVKIEGFDVGFQLTENNAVGDLDGDGYADLLVCDERSGAALGFVFAFTGPITASADARTAAVTLSEVDAHSVALPGDLDGDGSADVLVQSELVEGSSANAQVFYAPAGVALADAVLVPKDAGADRVENVVGIGDQNGDGLADFATTGRFIDGIGGAFLFYGLPTGY